MGEYPALSDQEIAAITLQKMTLESGASLEDVRVAVNIEHLAI